MDATNAYQPVNLHTSSSSPSSQTIATASDFKTIVGDMRPLVPHDDALNLGANILLAIHENRVPRNVEIILDKITFPAIDDTHYVELPPNIILQDCEIQEGVVGFYRGSVDTPNEKACGIIIGDLGTQVCSMLVGCKNRSSFDAFTNFSTLPEGYAETGRRNASIKAITFWGERVLDGNGEESDRKKLISAAENPEIKAYASLYLGIVYWEKIGVERNVLLAWKYLKEATIDIDKSDIRRIPDDNVKKAIDLLGKIEILYPAVLRLPTDTIEWDVVDSSLFTDSLSSLEKRAMTHAMAGEFKEAIIVYELMEERTTDPYDKETIKKEIVSLRKDMNNKGDSTKKEAPLPNVSHSHLTIKISNTPIQKQKVTAEKTHLEKETSDIDSPTIPDVEYRNDDIDRQLTQAYLLSTPIGARRQDILKKIDPSLIKAFNDSKTTPFSLNIPRSEIFSHTIKTLYETLRKKSEADPSSIEKKKLAVDFYTLAKWCVLTYEQKEGAFEEERAHYTRAYFCIVMGYKWGDFNKQHKNALHDLSVTLLKTVTYFNTTGLYYAGSKNNSYYGLTQELVLYQSQDAFIRTSSHLDRQKLLSKGLAYLSGNDVVKNDEIAANYFHVLSKRDGLEKTLATLDKVSSNGEAHYLLGLAYWNVGRFPDDVNEEDYPSHVSTIVKDAVSCWSRSWASSNNDGRAAFLISRILTDKYTLRLLSSRGTMFDFPDSNHQLSKTPLLAVFKLSNKALARRFLTMAANQGHGKAAFNLARKFEAESKSIISNEAEKKAASLSAVEYYRVAHEADYPHAALKAAHILASQSIMPGNPLLQLPPKIINQTKFKLAKIYYRAAMADGSPEARDFLLKHDPEYVQKVEDDDPFNAKVTAAIDDDAL